MKNFLVGIILLLLTILMAPCFAQSYWYSFESTLEGWSTDAADDMPGPNWYIKPSRTMSDTGLWSLELYMANYNDATKIWIEKSFQVPAWDKYKVKVTWRFCTRDFGMVNLFNLISSIGVKDPETMADFKVIGHTGNGDGDQWIWLSKSYEAEVTAGSSQIPNKGVIWVALGVWGTWETPRTYYLDSLTVDIKPARDPAIVSIGEARNLPDKAFVRIANIAATSGTADLAGRIYVEELNRSAGIAVETSANPPEVSKNDLLVVTGVMQTVGGERIVDNAVIERLPMEFTPNIKSIYIANREIGGGSFGAYTRGVIGCDSLNNIGLLIEASGRVVWRGSDFFVINDGSRAVSSGKTPVSGIAVSTTGLVGGGVIPSPPEGSWVMLTGLSSCFMDSLGMLYPLIQPRGAWDIWTLAP